MPSMTAMAIHIMVSIGDSVDKQGNALVRIESPEKDRDATDVWFVANTIILPVIDIRSMKVGVL